MQRTLFLAHQGPDTSRPGIERCTGSYAVARPVLQTSIVGPCVAFLTGCWHSHQVVRLFTATNLQQLLTFMTYGTIVSGFTQLLRGRLWSAAMQGMRCAWNHDIQRSDDQHAQLGKNTSPFWLDTASSQTSDARRAAMHVAATAAASHCSASSPAALTQQGAGDVLDVASRADGAC